MPETEVTPKPTAPAMATPAPAVAAKPAAPAKRGLQMNTWRGSQSEFKAGKARAWFTSLMVDELINLSQSESDGNVNITIIYR